ncbi:hypothetical protein QBC45DRAFT_72035 [Copromyces sp. CBS 386.78]|nr:hypothetical protein QBC45DRAFT_72035 [Copromyces sp. CBS 386.78]
MPSPCRTFLSFLRIGQAILSALTLSLPSTAIALPAPEPGSVIGSLPSAVSQVAKDLNGRDDHGPTNTTGGGACFKTTYPSLSASPDKQVPYIMSLVCPEHGLGNGTDIAFTIPKDAIGVGACTLFFALPPPSANVTGKARIDIRSIDGPAPGGLAGTVSIPEAGAGPINGTTASKKNKRHNGEQHGDTDKPEGNAQDQCGDKCGKAREVNSFPCREKMAFRLSVNNDDGKYKNGNEVSFLEGEGSGFWIRYGC